MAGGEIRLPTALRSEAWRARVGHPELDEAETRPAHLPPGSPLGDYRGLLTDRRFIGYTLAGGFAQAGMFAYISGSPFVFIDLFGVPAQAYGWLFGMNAAGIIGAALLATQTQDQRGRHKA